MSSKHELTDDERGKCHIVIHGAATVCAGISALLGEGAAIGADTWFLRGIQGIMFTILGNVLSVPGEAAVIYAVKGMWSGAVIGVDAARILISLLGIGADVVTGGGTVAPVAMGVRGVIPISIRLALD